MSRRLPFEGYSWQISQHEIAFSEETTLALLGSAQQFDGQLNSSYRAELNEFIAESGILTENVRNGTASPWRDYQQVLAELGLIVSTKISDRLVLTPVGRAYLAGNIPFAVMLTIQLLRYQYPNGQKDKIAGLNSIEACVEADVSIRPAVTLLRILCELYFHGKYGLTAQEILAFVLPNGLDRDWRVSVAEILESRRTTGANNHAARNVRAWIKMLGKTVLFSAQGNQSLHLSQTAIAQLDAVKSVADELIATPTWRSRGSDANARWQWFEFFGSVGTLSPRLEGLLATQVSEDLFIREPHDEEAATNSAIALQPFEELDTSVRLPSGLEPDALLRSMLRGQAKLAFSKSEHDKLVNLVAKKYTERGYVVKSDPKSIDIMATSPCGKCDIIEIKTVNPLNMTKQVRAGFGQILEYDFRLLLQTESASGKYVAVNRPVNHGDWRKNFCNAYGVKLVAVSDLIE